MNFKPKTEKQLKEEMLIPAGEYDFEVVKAEEKPSKSGNPMIALNLKVFMEDGTHRFANDWLMTTSASMEWKLRKFCVSTGLDGLYDQGALTGDDCIGRAGRVVIGQKDDPQYGPQNTVKDYVEPASPAAAPAPAQAAPASAPSSGPPRAVPAHARKPMEPDEIPF